MNTRSGKVSLGRLGVIGTAIVSVLLILVLVFPISANINVFNSGFLSIGLSQVSARPESGGEFLDEYVPPLLTLQAAEKDTILSEEYYDLNLGADTFLSVGPHASWNCRSILEFGISELPPGITITLATFSLYYNSYESFDPVGVTVWTYKLSRTDWEEMQSTWNIYKTGFSWTAAGGDYVTSSPPGASTTFPGTLNTWMNWNVLSIVQDAYSSSNPVELIVRLDNEDGSTEDYYNWVSTEYSTESLRPKLYIEYEYPINSPTANTGSGWTNPTYAYDNDGSGYASITSGNPSGSNIWGTYDFSFTTESITQVWVRYDAWSAGYTLPGTSITRQATGDDTNTGGFITAPLYSKINDSNDATYITGVTTAGGHATFTFTAFDVPAGSTISYVQIHYRHRSATTVTGYAHGACIKVNGIYYSMKDTAGWDAGHTTGVASSSPIENHTYNGTANPATGLTWTVSAVNALTAFGVGSTDFDPDANFYQIDISVYYIPPSTEYNDQIKVDVSWDGGSSWSSTQNTTLTSAEITYWYDVTSATTWTAAKLNNTNLKVRALAQIVGDAEVVRLDWIPVVVTWTSGAVPEIINLPDVYGFGILEVNTTGNTAINYFTLNNTGNCPVDVTIQGTDMTGGGYTWTLSGTATPGNMIFGLKAGLDDADDNFDITVNTTANVFVNDLAEGVTKAWGLKIWSPTSYNDGNLKTGIVTLTATCA